MNGPAYTSLRSRLTQVQGAFEVLAWAIVQAQPSTEQGHALADHYDETVMELTGWVQAACNALDRSQATAPELLPGRAGLLHCQQQFNQLFSRFYCDLVSFERISELNELARRKEPQWAGWVRGVRDALGQCHQPLYDLSQALLEAWGELTQRADNAATSRQTDMNTGRVLHLVSDVKNQQSG